MVKARLALPRRTIATIGVAVTIGALLIGYVFVSMQAWEKVDTVTASSARDIEHAKGFLFADTTESGERHVIVERLAQANTGTTCGVGWWGDWQSLLFTAAKMTKKTCEEMRTQYVDVQREAKKVLQFLSDQASIQSILVRLSLGRSVITESAIQKHVNKVVAIDKEISEIVLHSDSLPLKTSARSVVGRISSAWLRVQKSDESENRKEYEVALKTLESAYRELTTVSKKATTMYASVLVKLQNSLT